MAAQRRRCGADLPSAPRVTLEPLIPSLTIDPACLPIRIENQERTLPDFLSSLSRRRDASSVDAVVDARALLLDLAPTVPDAPLSIQMRGRTAIVHERVEHLLGLPAAIRTRDDYARWLGRFLGFYAPLEAVLAAVAPAPADTDAGLLASHAYRLVDDLRHLGVDPAHLPRVAAPALPRLPTFAHVAGSRYVLMGATLGGRYILRDLEVRLGPALGDATCFFGGAGPLTGRNWKAFRASLDDFGRRHPALHADVAAGAIETFHALHAWFVPFCDGRESAS